MHLNQPHSIPDAGHQAQPFRSLASLQRLFVGTLIGTFLQLLVLLPSPALAQVSLGVVRSSDNSSEWIQITTRLWESGIPYKPINLEQINSVADLAGIQVLFLPNIETLTPTQVRILEEWSKQGGKFIAAGPVGRSSPALVRQALRSLLGAYWAFPLTDRTTPQPRYRCRDLACKVSSNWVPPEQPNAKVMGGVLIPADMNSQTVAIWQQSDGSAAAIATDRATYLGWRWGRDGSQELDKAWLQAALNRFGNNPAGNIASQGNPTSPIAPPPPPATTGPSRPIAPPIPSSPNPNNATALAKPPIAPDPLVPDAFTDPSEQSAPPGLNIEANGKAITSTEAYLMRQELSNLLGRVESASIAAASANMPINLNAANPASLVAARNPVVSASATRSMEVQGAAGQAIAQAKQVLQNFDQLLATQNYAAARQQWLSARQLLWQNYPTDGQRAGAEIRAVWLDRGTIVRSGSEAGLAAIFDRLAQAGINTVFFETLNAGYPIYPSQVAPQQNPLTASWDPLATAVKLAHDRGMELHAWIWTFATGNKRHNALLGLPNDYPGPVLSAHPDWANLDNQGRRQHVNDGKFYLDPANPEARNYLLQIVNEIVSRYKVDGLQLDYIRYPFQDPNVGFSFGYGKAGRQQFQQLTGVDPAKISPGDGNLWRQWTEFKTNQVSSFVGEVSQFLRRNSPHVILSVAVFPHPEYQRIYLIQQNWEAWARQGWVDLVVPMTYALDTNRLQRIAQPLTKEENIGPALIAPSVKLLRLPEIVAIDQIQALRDLTTGGYAIFAVETLSHGLQGFFNRTQGQETVRSQRGSEPIPYRRPFAAAASRFTALKQEWSFLLANSQLRIQDSDLKTLRAQSEELAQKLNQLATNPSPERLATVQRLLETYEAQFTAAMRLHAIENPYQVQTWQNRVASLKMLLRYGERVELNRP